MKKITKKKAKEVLSKILVQITNLNKADLDWKLSELVSGFSLGNGKYRLKIKGDWDDIYYECVKINKDKKIVFYSSFKTDSKKKKYFNYDGEPLKPKQLAKISPYLFNSLT